MWETDKNILYGKQRRMNGNSKKKEKKKENTVHVHVVTNPRLTYN